MGPFQTTTFKDTATLNAADALLRGMSHSGLAVQVVASGMDQGRPTIITEPHMPLPGGDAIVRALIDASRHIAGQATYNDADIHRAATSGHSLFTASQYGFLKNMLTTCISLERQGNRIESFALGQVQTPSGFAWRVVGGSVHAGLGAEPFPSSHPAPSMRNISGLVDFLRTGVENGKIPSDLFSMRPQTESDQTESQNAENSGQAVLQALIPGATIAGSGEDGFVLDIGDGKVLKVWHGNGSDDMAEWQNGRPSAEPKPVNRPNIELMCIALLQHSEAKHLIPAMSTYGFAGPFRVMIRDNLRDVELPLLGFDHDHSYLTDVLSLAERLSYPETDSRRPDMSDDDIVDELAYIVAQNEIEEGADHGQNDPFMDRQFLDNMIVFFRESRRLGIGPEDMANTTNYGLDEDGNLRLRDLSRFAFSVGPFQNGHGIYPGGYILSDVIAHGAKVEGLIQTIMPEQNAEPTRTIE